MAAGREFTLIFHVPASGTGKAGDLKAFRFSDTTIVFEAIILKDLAALFSGWRVENSS